MVHRIVSALLIALLIVVCSPDLVNGQPVDSLLYVIDNDLVQNDAEEYDLLCQVIPEIDEPETRIRYCDRAIELAQKLEILPAQPYELKGNAYADVGKYALALEYLIEAAGYYEQNEDYRSLGRTYNSVGIIYNLQGNRENEKRYLQMASKILEQEKDSFSLPYVLHNLGYFNYTMGQYDTALVVLSQTLDQFKELDDPYNYYVCLGNLGLVHSRLSELDQAEAYLRTAIDTLARLDDNYALPEFMIEYADIQWQKGETKQAKDYASRALNITDSPNYERDASSLLARIYANSGRYDSAYYFQSIFITANDSVKNIESVQEMANLQTKYEVGRKQAEVEVLEKKKQNQRIAIIGLAIILMLAIGLVSLYYTYLKRSRKLTEALEERRVLLEKHSAELKEKNERILRTNEQLKQLNDEINAQKEEIESQRDYLFTQKEEITESINYAQRIQSAMLPPESYVNELLDKVFILFKPRDIVSGDFYWFKQVNKYTIIAAADCTGHGVPGAFMSMLGMSYLNEIVQRREITQANQVLNEMRSQIIHSLRQHGRPEETKDGIDMAICVLDQKTRMMQYGGANNPLYIIRGTTGKPELIEIKPDRMPVGYYQGRFKTFTNNDIQLEHGDVFYLFSDGYVDQKGGKDEKKFLSKNFKNLLIKIHQEPMLEQKRILEKTLTKWMGDQPQIDDILVIGVRI